MTQSGGFDIIKMGDLVNNIVDYSNLVTKSPTPQQFGMADVTAFTVGGGQPVTKKIHGAVQSNIQLEVLVDPTTSLLKDQIIGLRSGITIQMAIGRNAAPSIGDQLWQGTYSLCGLTLNAATNDKPLTETWDFEPSDVGVSGITPGWYPF